MLAKTPPMGWNSWNTFTDEINEDLICQTADAMVREGLLDAGYEYLVIDDCWSEMERDAKGNLVADHVKFPRGMKAVADYVHARGLKFGMYSCDGIKTCAGYPGSYGHEFEDAQFFADNGVDFLKYDNCYHPETPNLFSYNVMSMALKATGREMLFSACNWGTEDVWQWARSVGAHMYRSTGDITDTFESVREISESQKTKLAYSAPGCFNDLDMLVTGLKGTGNIGFGKGCTPEQYRYHFAMWCLFGSPLMLGCDVRSLTPELKELIANRELIRINQDEEARPPLFARDTRGMFDNTILFKHLSGGEYAIAFFNPYDQPKGNNLPYFAIGLDPRCGYGFELYDVMSGEQLGRFRDYVEVDEVPAGGCRVLRGRLVKL